VCCSVLQFKLSPTVNLDCSRRLSSCVVAESKQSSTFNLFVYSQVVRFLYEKRAINYRALVRKTTYQDLPNLHRRLLSIHEATADCTKFTVCKSFKGRRETQDLFVFTCSAYLHASVCACTCCCASE